MDYESLRANELARLCSQTDSAEAWAEFIRRFQRPIALVVLRTIRSWGTPSPALVDDMVQEVFLRLCADNCKLLRNFEAREEDSVIGYLKVIAANLTHDHLRSERSLKRGGAANMIQDDARELHTLAAPHSTTESAERFTELREIDEALKSSIPDPLTERDRTIFWLYFQQGFAAREIADIASIGLTVKGVESSIHRTTRHLRHRLQKPVSASGKRLFASADDL